VGWGLGVDEAACDDAASVTTAAAISTSVATTTATAAAAAAGAFTAAVVSACMAANAAVAASTAAAGNGPLPPPPRVSSARTNGTSCRCVRSVLPQLHERWEREPRRHVDEQCCATPCEGFQLQYFAMSSTDEWTRGYVLRTNAPAPVFEGISRDVRMVLELLRCCSEPVPRQSSISFISVGQPSILGASGATAVSSALTRARRPAGAL